MKLAFFKVRGSRAGNGMLPQLCAHKEKQQS